MSCGWWCFSTFFRLQKASWTENSLSKLTGLCETNKKVWNPTDIQRTTITTLPGFTDKTYVHRLWGLLAIAFLKARMIFMNAFNLHWIVYYFLRISLNWISLNMLWSEKYLQFKAKRYKSRPTCWYKICVSALHITECMCVINCRWVMTIINNFLLLVARKKNSFTAI